jgi:hypothetical protein
LNAVRQHARLARGKKNATGHTNRALFAFLDERKRRAAARERDDTSLQARWMAFVEHDSDDSDDDDDDDDDDYYYEGDFFDEPELNHEDEEDDDDEGHDDDDDDDDKRLNASLVDDENERWRLADHSRGEAFPTPPNDLLLRNVLAAVRQVEVDSVFVHCGVCEQHTRIVDTSLRRLDWSRLTLLTPNPSSSFSDDVLNYYDMSINNDIVAKGIVLSRRGLATSGGEAALPSYATHVRVCRTCSRALERNHLPALSLANDFMVGETPAALACLTPREQMCVARLITRAHLFRPQSGGGAATLARSGYMLYFEAQPIVFDELLLPRSLEDERSHAIIIMSACNTSSEREEAENRYRVNIHRVRRALDWLRLNNPL